MGAVEYSSEEVERGIKHSSRAGVSRGKLEHEVFES